MALKTVNAYLNFDGTASDAIALYERALLADGALAVDPIRLIEQAAAIRHLLRRQDVRHVDHHVPDARTMDLRTRS